jgi:hypothetical protein
MAKKPAPDKSDKSVEKAEVAAPVITEPQKSKKIPKLAKKNKHRLPRKEKKAQKKAALKA